MDQEAYDHSPTQREALRVLKEHGCHWQDFITYCKSEGLRWDTPSVLLNWLGY